MSFSPLHYSSRIFCAWILLFDPLEAVEAELSPMELSVMRLDTYSENLPACIEVIDRQEIEKSTGLDLVELLRRNTNLSIRSTSGNSARSDLSLGGFGENGSQRTLVLLDGHRLNASDMSPVNWPSIPLSQIESIEVIQGGQAGTFGNHAVGGVIKINTREPTDKGSGSAEFSLGNFDTTNARGSYSQRVGSVGITLFGEQFDTNGYRMNGDHKTDSGGVRLDWGGENEWKGYFTGSLSDTNFGLPGDLNASALLVDRRQSRNTLDRGEDRIAHVRSGLSFPLNDFTTLENRLGYQNREIGVSMPSAGWIANTHYDTLTYTPAIHFSSDTTDWMLGFDYSLDEVRADTNFDDSELERSTIALFAARNQSLGDQWCWNGNLRFEIMKDSGTYADTVLNEVKKEQWAGGLGVVRKFEDEKRVYSAVRRFFRYPATDEILLAWPPPSSFDADLAPETGFEVELGSEWKKRQFALHGRIFRQWMKNEIIYDSSTWANLNLEDTSRIGLDLSFHWLPRKWVGGGVDYSFVRATIEEGKFSGSKVPLVPERLLRLFLDLHPLDSLDVHLGASLVGDSFPGSDFYNSGNKLPDYWLFDLSLNYQISEEFHLFGGAENLLDEEYLSTAYGNGLYPGEGRKLRVGIRYSF
jgi:iron complex outermembrane receptor protein